MRKIFLLLAAIVALSSCSITKRHYAPGYHVEWKELGNQESATQSEIVSAEFNGVQPKEKNDVGNPVCAVGFANQSNQIFIPQFEIPQNGEFIVSEVLPIIQDPRLAIEKGNESVEWNANLQVDSSELNYSNDFVILDEKEEPKRNRWALFGFILGLSSLYLLLPAPIGLVFGWIGLRQIGQGKGRGKGMAKAAIVLSIIGLLEFITLIILLAKYPIG